MSDPSVWAWWRAALAGKEPEVHEGDPQWGFYRVKQGRVGKWLPVAIFGSKADPSKLVMKYGEEQINDRSKIDELWTYACQHPIKHEQYTEFLEKKVWFDDAPSMIGHNQPHEEDADPFDIIAATLDEELLSAKPFLDKPVTTQDQADQAATWAKRLRELYKRAEGERRGAKVPIEAELSRIDERWRPLVDKIKKLGEQITQHPADFILKKQREAAKAAAEAKAKEEIALKAAQEAAMKAQEADMSPEELAKAERAQQAAEDAAAKAQKAQKATKVSAGRTGAKLSTRTVTKAQIDDLVEAATFFAKQGDADLRDLIQRKADKIIQHVEVPGCSKVTETKLTG